MSATFGHYAETKAFWTTDQRGGCWSLEYKTAAHGFDKC